MLQQDKPDDFVLATGEQHSVREFCDICFKFIGIDIVYVLRFALNSPEGWPRDFEWVSVALLDVTLV